MTQLEREIEAKLRKLVKEHGGFCLKWSSPGSSGVPDRIVLLPGGRVYFIETKRPKDGELSELQKWWGGMIIKLGFPWLCIWDEDDLDYFKQEITEGKK